MSKMLERILIIFCALIVCANCQIPGFGRCPEFQAMQDFKRDRFLGQWFEAERYFSVSEVAAKCIAATYSRRADGKIYVDNFYMNRM